MGKQRFFKSGDQAFAALFKEAREKKGLTQDEVARHLVMRGYDFVQQTVYRIEKGQRKVTVGEASALAELVELPIENLTNRSPDSAESLNRELERLGNDYMEQILNLLEGARGAEFTRLHYKATLNDYAQAGDAVAAISDTTKLPLSQIFTVFSDFQGTRDLILSWKQHVQLVETKAVLHGLGWGEDELSDVDIALVYKPELPEG
jgi:transcriptional regulator with XRE-family HTH domain